MADGEIKIQSCKRFTGQASALHIKPISTATEDLKIGEKVVIAYQQVSTQVLENIRKTCRHSRNLPSKYASLEMLLEYLYHFWLP